MSTVEPQPQGPEVVVAEDGSVPGIPADVLARFGYRPGTHLRLVPEGVIEQRPHKSIMGALEGKVNVDGFEEAMAWGKQDRIDQVMREDDDQ